MLEIAAAVLTLALPLAKFPEMPGAIGLSKMLPVVGSVYSALNVLPILSFSVPSLFVVPALLDVSNVPRNIPVLTPVSVKVLTSTSLVWLFVTVMVRVSATALFLFWSASLTCKPIVLPGL